MIPLNVIYRVIMVPLQSRTWDRSVIVYGDDDDNNKEANDGGESGYDAEEEDGDYDNVYLHIYNIIFNNYKV